MNSTKRVFLFVVVSTLLLLLLSLADIFFSWSFTPLQRINLVADVFPGADNNNPTDSSEAIVLDTTSTHAQKFATNFDLYTEPGAITNFNADTSAVSMMQLVKQLQQLKQQKKGKIRIAYFGDSMIESDLLTQTLRKLLQQYFGGQGVGYIPISTQTYKLRQTVVHDIGGSWKVTNMKNATDKKYMYLSGYTFTTANGWIQVTDKTITDSTVATEKILLCGYAPNPITISVNGKPFVVQANKLFNRIVLSTDNSNKLTVHVTDASLPVYGIAFEPTDGVVVDNFSFRGTSGELLKPLDSTFLTTINQQNPYNIMVFQYGVNVMFRPNDTKFNWYKSIFEPVVKKFTNCFPSTGIIISSTADRAFRYADGYKTAIGIDSLIKLQAAIAFETGNMFYNLYATMGGRQTIVKWADAKPPLANKDYVHPNHAGAAILGEYFFNAVRKEYDKYEQSLH